MKKNVLRKWHFGIVLMLLLALVAGCAKTVEENESGATYHKITPEEALEKMVEEEEAIILDVRTAEEFATGHISEATLLPLDEINAGNLDLLPDKDAVILVYCRSGNRSKQAADALVDEGYTNVYDFGGILDWPYDIVD